MQATCGLVAPRGVLAGRSKNNKQSPSFFKSGESIVKIKKFARIDDLSKVLARVRAPEGRRGLTNKSREVESLASQTGRTFPGFIIQHEPAAGIFGCS
jgi:hypothetical protein